MQLGRILEIRDTSDDRVPARLQQPVVRRADVPEVPRVDDDLHALVFGSELSKDLDRAVRRCVVDEEVLVVVVGHSRHHVPDLAVDLANVLLLVEARSENRQMGHVMVLSREGRVAARRLRPSSRPLGERPSSALRRS